LDVVEISSNLRRATFADRDASVSTRATVENIGGEVVQLDLAISSNNPRARLAQVHASQHAATDTQISAGAVTARRLNYKHGLDELDVLSLAVRNLHRTGIDIGSRTLDASIAHGQSHTGDVERANLCSGCMRCSNLHVFHDNTRDSTAIFERDVVSRDSLNFRARSRNVSGFDARNRSSGDFVLFADLKV